MATVSNAIATLRLNNTPFWWLSNGSGKKVGQYLDSSDLDASISKLNEVYELLPDGTYTLKASDKEQNHSGANHFTFSKSSKGTQTSTMQPIVHSSNAYGIADHVLKQIQEETRRTLLFEQMSAQFGPMAELVKDLEKRLEKVEKILADEDGDGSPDIFEMTRKATEVVKAGKEIKGFFN